MPVVIRSLARSCRRKARHVGIVGVASSLGVMGAALLSTRCAVGNSHTGVAGAGGAGVVFTVGTAGQTPDAATTGRCGDGVMALVGEQCDDGNQTSGDGCSSTCTLESGYACPFPGLPCVAAACGDSIVAGVEECDDGNAISGDGCSDTCRLEDGWKCDTPGAACQHTTCGDGVREGTEQCDDGNFDMGDGCTPLCATEPDCTNGPCTSACGDGIVLGAEACDDGNRRSGDGCSSTCTVETGFYCQQPPLPSQMQIPLVVRDFNGLDPLPSVTNGPPPDYTESNHVDFELVLDEPGGLEDGTTSRIVRSGQGSTASGRGLDLGQPGETFAIQHLDGSPIATVSLAGKPVYSLPRSACDKTALPSSSNAWDKCTITTMDGDSFHTWYVDHATQGSPVTWPNFLGRGSTKVKRLTLLLGSFADATFTAGGTSYTFDSRYMLIDGTMPPVIAGTSPELRTRGFFPIDELGSTGVTCNDNQGGNEPHNFHFTSEIRFWFQYAATSSPELDFSGDDDVWVYVNGHLALDIGGIHDRTAKSFVVDAANAAAWGLADGQVYEVAVFQAERNQCASNYWLTLQGFNTSRSSCESRCGDGIIASDELCDDGPNNATQSPPAYGQCGPDCRTRGAYCGDKIVQSPEQCDDGPSGSEDCTPTCLSRIR